MHIGLFIVYTKESQVRKIFQNKMHLIPGGSLYRFICIVANSGDPDEMQRYVAFRLVFAV